ncbi:hypothetical protein K1T71_008568 [Dendrolimus kikuchii]|uniref:Uncharacterized protein n=1 Tax=Dendrolimus kikuchii TaxID=765133 RepID=A0ACC1CUQ2_9NEOP|nr:hypothetical protein K1T71_008568 [Dendrolimus kikuchii]
MKHCSAVLQNWTQRLEECLSYLIGLLCFCFHNKVSATAETRQIEVGVVDEADKKKHNKIKTSKYTLLTFLPKNLSEQFRRIVNFYFLMVTVIAIVIDSPVSPMTSIAPLSFMVLVTAVKQGYEDWLRHRADNRVNNQIVEIVHKGVVKEVKNSTIAPGTLVRVKRGREVPADLVLLCSAGEKGKCYVTTANLDGETNLKTLRVPPPLVGYTPDILPNGMRVEIPSPLADLYTFYGRFEIPGADSLVLTTDNLMLRGSRVKNTEWAIGCAIYTGEETKLALNSKYTGNKFSSCELAVNAFLVVFVALLVVEMLVSLGAKMYIEMKHPERTLYLGEHTTKVFEDLFSFLLLYYYIVPMSLYVTIELYKFLGALFIGWDEDLKCEETGRPAVANTSDLNEELGQVEVLFSDKTGTLTKNLMVFKACSIKGQVYEERDSKLYDVGRFDEPVDTLQTDIKFFFTILALCHCVQISNEDMKKLSAKFSSSGNLDILPSLFRRKKLKPTEAIQPANDGQNLDWNTIMSGINKKMDYQGSSPDEKALVEAADRAGVTFLGEEGNNLLLKIGEDTEMYERLQLIEFTSERKRMSVIVRDKDGKVCRRHPFRNGKRIQFPALGRPVVRRDKTTHSQVVPGLKYVAIATLSCVPTLVTRFQSPLKEQQPIKRLDGKNAEALQQVAFQVETAINVAQSCAHISENDRRMFLIGVEEDVALQAHLDECKRITCEPSYRDLTLIVDGTSMTQVLDTKFAPLFANIALKCHAVLCCRLSPIQKAKIVKLIKVSGNRPITAAIGDGANDISMIQEAHVGIGIFGREGHQAASYSLDWNQLIIYDSLTLTTNTIEYCQKAKKIVLVLDFFFQEISKLFIFQIHTAFSTQSVFDSMYLTFFNLVFTSLPVLVLSVTEQRWPADLLLKNPTLYMEISRNKLMSWSHFSVWCFAATYHSVIIYVFTDLTIINSVINMDGKNLDLWMYGAALFHLLVLVVNLKIWLQARYHTLVFVLSVVLSIATYIIFNTIYSLFYVQIDGDVLWTYIRLLSSPAFWFLTCAVIIATLGPDFMIRIISDKWGNRRKQTTVIANRNVFVTSL